MNNDGSLSQEALMEIICELQNQVRVVSFPRSTQYHNPCNPQWQVESTMVTMSDQVSAQAKKCKLLQGQLIESQRQLKATCGALEATTRERDALKEGVGTIDAGAGIERAPEADAEMFEAQRARQEQAEDRAVIDRLQAEAKEHCAIIVRLQSSNLDLKVNLKILALFNHCSFRMMTR